MRDWSREGQTELRAALADEVDAIKKRLGVQHAVVIVMDLQDTPQGPVLHSFDLGDSAVPLSQVYAALAQSSAEREGGTAQAIYEAQGKTRQ